MNFWIIKINYWMNEVLLRTFVTSYALFIYKKIWLKSIYCFHFLRKNEKNTVFFFWVMKDYFLSQKVITIWIIIVNKTCFIWSAFMLPFADLSAWLKLNGNFNGVIKFSFLLKYILRKIEIIKYSWNSLSPYLNFFHLYYFAFFSNLLC